MAPPADAHLLLAAAAALASAAAALGATYLATPPLIRRLEARGMCVPDICKPGRPMIPRPGGISIAAALLAGMAAAYAVHPSSAVAAAAAVTAGAFAVGLIDDLRVMGGWFKPVGLALCAAPIFALGAYDTSMAFPPFGDVGIPLLYLAVIPVMVSTMGNTANSIDVGNGILSGAMAIAGAALAAALALAGSYPAAAAAAALVAASVAFYRFHRLPSRIFPGDSGALALGGAYGALAVVGGVEIVAVIAVLPAVFNSFLYLASVRRIVEHRQLEGGSGVDILPDWRLVASPRPNAPLSLVRLLVSDGPLTEGQVCTAILRLVAFSSCLAVATAAAGALMP